MTQHRKIIASWIGSAIAAALLATAPVSAAGNHDGGHDDGGHGHGAAFGQPGAAADVDRTIEIDMTDNRFSVPALTVRAGETIRFVLHNKGKLLHEFALGTPDMHQDHLGEMAEMFASGALSILGSKEAGHMDAPETVGAGAEHAHAGQMHGDDEAHADANAVLVDPGDTAEFIWTFAHSAAEIQFACTVPGHYEAGMVGSLTIGD